MKFSGMSTCARHSPGGLMPGFIPISIGVGIGGGLAVRILPMLSGISSAIFSAGDADKETVARRCFVEPIFVTIWISLLKKPPGEAPRLFVFHHGIIAKPVMVPERNRERLPRLAQPVMGRDKSGCNRVFSVSSSRARLVTVQAKRSRILVRPVMEQERYGGTRRWKSKYLPVLMTE